MNSHTEYEEREQPSKRGIYLLPNFFTTAALFSGFYAIVSAMKGHIPQAAIAIYIAMIADSLDGRVARLTNTQTAFGAEYDSLSDLIAFGVAPALIAYSWILLHLGKLGWLAAFFYTASTALRLARFNVQAVGKRYFLGLPCPSAAAIIVGAIWLEHIYHLHGYWFGMLTATLMVLAGLLMISTIRYRSFKDLELKGVPSFVPILILIGLFVGISFNPPLVLFGMFACYAVSGPLVALFDLRKKVFKKVFLREK